MKKIIPMTDVFASVCFSFKVSLKEDWHVHVTTFNAKAQKVQ